MEGIENIVWIGLWLFGGVAVVGLAAVGGFVYMTKAHAMKGK